ncbi:translocation/assembly module TamB domain-containing protein [uncultured Sphingomonas sp.]|uniref:translocation/assembly module TamB domain-containing protein n=1 Tax=uncultured Sphingomonas sp. TaxID=158754 RepID=UPI0025F5AD40|nr:translocation/assembly module TamB domain-containing protein [uncultured Sphingomonas sp.]
MTDEPVAAPPPVVVKRRIGWGRRLLQLVLAIVVLIAGALVVIDTGPGHRLIANRIATMKPANGLRYRIGRIDGSIYTRARLIDVRIYDSKGLILRAPLAELDWRPWEFLSNRLSINSLTIPRAILAKLPQPTPTGRKTPILPSFDIRIGRLSVERLELAKAVTGTPRIGKLAGQADVRSGRALVDLALDVAASDRLRLRLDAEPDRDRFDIDLRARGVSDGLLATASGIRRPLAVEVSGDGRWSAWDGRAVADAGRARIIDLTLGVRAGRYMLGGTLAPSSLLQGKLQRLTAPQVRVTGSATFADRRIDGVLALRSAALAMEAQGVVDLGTSAFRDLRLRARLLRPAAMFPNMTGRDIELRAILDGAFSTARFDYRLRASRLAFDQTGFEQVVAAGQGRFSKAPVIVPIRLAAARVTGVGDVAGGILRNLSVTGKLAVDAKTLVGNDLIVRSDKLNGRIMLTLDLATGRYEVGISGALQRYLIPGLGLVDVQTRLTAVPIPGGGTRIVGRGMAQVRRLDNGFFRSLTQGLPRIETGLERGRDGILYLRGLRLTSPGLTLSGNGYRRRDGTFHFEGSGRQTTYGPVQLILDGNISKPTLDLRFASPNATLGLADVVAHLDPTAEGFAYRATGGSRLGPFTADGRILLPSGGTARVAVDELEVSGTRATGGVDIVEDGFLGRLNVDGGGIAGTIDFAPQGSDQRIDIALEATRARLGVAGSVRRARLEAGIVLADGGTTLDATMTAQGFRRGKLSIARLAGSARLVDGVGEVRAAIAGSRGRAFSIQSVTQVTADEYRISAEGTLDRRPLKLETPAVIRREGDGWRLAPTQFSFAGGTATVGGAVGADSTELALDVTRMPLAVLDIGYPGLGLSGSASGKIAFATRGSTPSGRVDLTIRGLSRSGLVVSSTPIDVGVAAVLDANRAGVRAVMASGGKTIGRAQARLSPLGEGDLATRLNNAPLFAQLRYGGPADTLWRLTGIELFDLSGPVSVGADVTGRLADPRIRGVVRSSGARIESAITGTVLTGVEAQGRFDGSRLVIDRFAANDGRQGRVTGTGAFEFAAVRGFGIDLSLNADRARLINTDSIGATVTGPIRVRSDGAGGMISGEVRMDGSRYRLGRATATAPIPRLNIREINRPDGDDEASAAVVPWKLDLKARAPGGLIVTGLGLTSEWSADLAITGEPTSPIINGRADLIRGDYEFAGREFRVDRGALRFNGESPADPALDIVANADTQGLNATIRVAGTATRPEISFQSVPALPEDELLSRLLFGTSITNLSAPEALQLAAAVAALQNGEGGLNPINAVRRAAGLDRLRILPADPQTGQGTSVAAGKYLTRRFYAEIVTDGQGYSATRIEFQVTRWLSLLASISTIGRQSTNVRISRDY